MNGCLFYRPKSTSDTFSRFLSRLVSCCFFLPASTSSWEHSRRNSLIGSILLIYVFSLLFSIWVFLHEQSRMTGQQWNREVIFFSSSIPLSFLLLYIRKPSQVTTCSKMLIDIFSNNKNLKNFMAPFLWMQFNCLKARATSRRQFTSLI